jgi:hypothetical protein
MKIDNLLPELLMKNQFDPKKYRIEERNAINSIAAISL